MSTNKWKTEKVKLADVQPYDQNPRVITEKAMSGLKASLAEFGYIEPIVFNERTGHIVGGHQRFAVLTEEGIEEATMVVVDMSQEDELAANLTLNNPEIEGDWDEPLLSLLGQLEGADSDLFNALNMDGLQSSIEAMQPKTGSDSYEDSNKEIDIDELTEECDTKCPCCAFEWKVEAADVSVEETE